MKIIKVTIERIDYKIKTGFGGYKSLPTLHNVNEISDVNEVRSIGVMFETKEDAELFASKFPKSYKVKVGSLSYIENEKYVTKPHVGMMFNTFWMNEVTQERNETAIRKRDKFIEILKMIQQEK